jgi:hypothetical protein
MCLDEVGRQDVGRADEIGDEAGPRALVDFLRRADLHHLAVAEDGDAVGHRQSLALIMGDENEGDAERLLQRLEFLLHLLAQLEVERAQRLVEEQHPGAVDECPGQRDALALAAGELARPALAIFGQLHEFERAAGFSVARRLADPAHHQRVGDVVDDVQMRKQRIVLEDRVDVAPIGRNALRGLAEYLDMAGGRLVEAGDQPQAGRLARAGGSQHGEEFASLDLEVDLVDRLHRIRSGARPSGRKPL